MKTLSDCPKISKIETYRTTMKKKTSNESRTRRSEYYLKIMIATGYRFEGPCLCDHIAQNIEKILL